MLGVLPRLLPVPANTWPVPCPWVGVRAGSRRALYVHLTVVLALLWVAPAVVAAQAPLDAGLPDSPATRSAFDAGRGRPDPGAVGVDAAVSRPASPATATTAATTEPKKAPQAESQAAPAAGSGADSGRYASPPPGSSGAGEGGAPSAASAQPTGSPGGAEVRTSAPLPPGVEARPVPNYDGRAPAPAGAGETLLWVPRIVLFPLYVVSEYVVRLPLGAVVTAAEKGKWMAVLGDFFTFDEERKVGIVPTAYLEFGFEPSVGLYFFADDAVVDRNDFRVQAGMWPDDWWSLSVLDRWTTPNESFSVIASGAYVDRPDYLFHGVGSRTRDEDGARFAAVDTRGSLAIEGRPWRASLLRSDVGVRALRFSAQTEFADDDDPALATAIADPGHALSELPSGFETGYTAASFGSTVALDTRKPFPAQAGGVRVEVRGEYAHALDSVSSWMSAGTAVGGFVDVGSQRVVSLSGWADMVEPISGTLPFTELASLGGAQPMGGFFQGRLRDRTRAGVSFEYRWPVWIWVDMAFHYSVGNVFGAGFRGLDPGNLRSSIGVGLRSARTSEPDHSFQFLVALGTETFEQGSSIDTVRVLFGGSRGF